jgi:hypothetical protein
MVYEAAGFHGYSSRSDKRVADSDVPLAGEIRRLE